MSEEYSFAEFTVEIGLEGEALVYESEYDSCIVNPGEKKSFKLRIKKKEEDYVYITNLRGLLVEKITISYARLN